jgi:hypothetical protein
MAYEEYSGEQPFADNAATVLARKLLRDNADDGPVWWRLCPPLPHEHEFVRRLREFNGAHLQLGFEIGQRWTLRVRGLSHIAGDLGIWRPGQPGVVDRDKLKYYKNRFKVSCGFRRIWYRTRPVDCWVYCQSFREAIAKNLFWPDNNITQLEDDALANDDDVLVFSALAAIDDAAADSLLSAMQ